MSRIAKISGALMLVPLVACATPDFHARRVGEPISAQSDNQLLAAGRMQFGNGNFGLAIDAYRRVLRQAPQNIEAFVGLAASYDRLGRFDLARRYYEEALAIAPADLRVQTLYATTLRAHGLTDEAGQLEAQIAEAQAAAATATAAPTEAAAADPAPAEAPVQNAAAAPVDSAGGVWAPGPAAPATVQAPPARSAPVVASAAERPSGPRLERISEGEVMLVTRPDSVMSAENGFRRVEPVPEPVVASVLRNVAERGVATAQARPRPLPATLMPRRQSASAQPAAGARPPARILNAVGRRGQAARMEGHLRSLGWQQTSIGDSRARRAVSYILTPAAAAGEANALARSLPFRPRVIRTARVTQVMLVLGNDAVSFDQRLLRGNRAS